MAEGRQRSQWNQTAALLCMTANVNRDTSKRSTPFTPDEFNPFSEAKPAQPQTITHDEWAAIGKAFKKAYGNRKCTRH